MSSGSGNPDNAAAARSLRFKDTGKSEPDADVNISMPQGNHEIQPDRGSEPHKEVQAEHAVAELQGGAPGFRSPFPFDDWVAADGSRRVAHAGTI